MSRIYVSIDEPSYHITYVRFCYVISGMISTVVEVREEELVHEGVYFGILRTLVNSQELPEWM